MHGKRCHSFHGITLPAQAYATELFGLRVGSGGNGIPSYREHARSSLSCMPYDMGRFTSFG